MTSTWGELKKARDARRAGTLAELDEVQTTPEFTGEAREDRQEQASGLLGQEAVGGVESRRSLFGLKVESGRELEDKTEAGTYRVPVNLASEGLPSRDISSNPLPSRDIGAGALKSSVISSEGSVPSNKETIVPGQKPAGGSAVAPNVWSPPKGQ